MDKYVYNSWEYPWVKADPPAERFLRLILSPEVGSYEGATVLMSYIPPGSTTGRHTHDSDEIMYVSGRGTGTVGDLENQLNTDAVIFAPRGVEHECRNTSQTETLKLFCVYIPPLRLSPLLEQVVEKAREHLTGGC